MVAIDYELLVGAKKERRVKIFNHRIQWLVVGVCLPTCRDYFRLSVCGINARDVFYCKRYDFVLYSDENTGLVLRLLSKLIYTGYIDV